MLVVRYVMAALLQVWIRFRIEIYKGSYAVKKRYKFSAS